MEENTRMKGIGLSLVNTDDQVLFIDDTSLAADTEEKLCQLLEEFGVHRRNLSE